MEHIQRLSKDPKNLICGYKTDTSPMQVSVLYVMPAVTNCILSSIPIFIRRYANLLAKDPAEIGLVFEPDRPRNVGDAARCIA